MAGSYALVLAGAGTTLTMLYWLLSILKLRKKADFRGKVVLITGASSGLGEACAHAFYKAGAKVILAARRVEQLQRVKTDLLQIKTDVALQPPEVVYLDLEDMDSIPSVAEKVLSFHGRVDILINNGGISCRSAVMETTIQVDQKVMNVNYFGQVALTKALLPDMVHRHGGHILVVSSVQGKIATPYRSAYTASKHALQAFCDSLRAEIAHHNIHVTVVNPGYIKTSLSVNAVTGDGSQYGVMDNTTASGMSVDIVAKEIMEAITRQQNEVTLAPFIHRLAVYIRNIFPDLFFKLMYSRAEKQRKDFEKSK